MRASLCSTAVLGLSLLCGCAFVSRAPVPMRVVDHPGESGAAKCLFVLLPGMGDHAETFEQRGFIEELRSRRLSIDIRATEATFGYYARATILDRLAADVIAPAKARGYREIWLAGPSMGGFGALFYARAHPEQITGVLAIAPYLGDRELIAEIQAAGGLAHWPAPPRVNELSREEYQREVWRWLQAVTRGEEQAPLLFLGYGTADRLARVDALLAAELPPSRVFLTTGAHEWPAWRRVLASFLDSPDFASHCR